MAKQRTAYQCSECNSISQRNRPKCPECGAQFTLEAIEVDADYFKTGGNTSSGKKTAGAGLKTTGANTPTEKAQNFTQISQNPIQRTATGIQELDRVLGGGFVDREVVLFSGRPGAGKSSLCLSVADTYAQQGKTVLYSSGEESTQQIGLRAKRFGVESDNIFVVNEMNLETLLGHIEEVRPDFLIVDSLQTLASNDVNGSIGSISQSKEAAHTLTSIAKRDGITMMLVSQVTKSGDFSGSESIQHIVDATLFLESDTETPLKFLRAIKNRFGDTTEVGVFQHEEKGLVEVLDPSGIFIDEDNANAEDSIGSAIGIVSEGMRNLPVEIQALTAASSASFPRRQFSGVDYNRAQIVCAIADKHAGAKIAENDVYLSTLSGVKVQDPQTDLAVVAAILSSSKNAPFRDGKTRAAFVGEVGLNGIVRGGMMIENKIKEASRLGFDEIVVPQRRLDRSKVRNLDIKITEISYVSELSKLFKQQNRNRILDARE